MPIGKKNMTAKKKNTRCRMPYFTLNGKVVRCGKTWEHLLYKDGAEYSYKAKRHFTNPKYKSPKVFCESCRSLHNVINSINYPNGIRLI